MIMKKIYSVLVNEVFFENTINTWYSSMFIFINICVWVSDLCQDLHSDQSLVL